MVCRQRFVLYISVRDGRNNRNQVLMGPPGPPGKTGPKGKLDVVKGPLKYLLRPLLGKNQFAVTQRRYACIEPNLDNIY